MSDIFVSYASEDRERIMPLIRVLEKSGWSVFWDRTIPAGKTWREVIGGEIQSARCVVVVWTETSVKSRWVQEEAEAGVRRKVLIPVLLDQVEPPFGFGSIHAADLTGWDGDESAPALVRLLRDISTILGASPAVTEVEGRRRSEEEARRTAEEERAHEQERRRAEKESRRRREEAEDASREKEKSEAAARRRINQPSILSRLWRARPFVTAILIVVVLGVAGVALYHWMTMGPTNGDTGIAELLRRAEIAERESRLTEPPEDSAATYYRKILELDRDNAAARKGLARIAETFLGLAEGALAQRRFEEAAKNLEWAASVNPDHPRIAELQGEFERLRARETDQARADAEGRKKEELIRITEEHLRSAERALAERRFDEAAKNLEMAASVNPDHPAIVELRRQLEKLQAKNTRGVIIRSNLPGVNVFIDDQPVGTTSREGELAPKNLAPGPHHIAGRRSGFEPWEQEVVVRAGEPSSVVMEMKPRFLERVVEAAYPQQAGARIPFVDLDRGRQVDISDKDADFSFKDDGTGNFAGTPIFISAQNGARICRTVPTPENPWQCDRKAYGNSIEVRQGQWVICVTSRGRYCKMNIEMKGPILTVIHWLYEARFEGP